MALRSGILLRMRPYRKRLFRLMALWLIPRGDGGERRRRRAVKTPPRRPGSSIASGKKRGARLCSRS